MKQNKLIHLLALLALVACIPTTGPSQLPPTATPTVAAIATTVAPPPTDTAVPASATPTATAAPATDTPAPSLTPAPSDTAAATPTGCAPTDQDQYVYHPTRLTVLAACLRAAGVIDAIRTEVDGDLHMLLRLDPEFTNLLTAANQGEELGDLVIEPVCVKSVTQADAIAVCASDLDPMGGPFPSVGQHVWMEGRYVLDKEHGGWAELHPLYRWGLPGAPALSTPPPLATATRVRITFTPAPAQATATQPQVAPTQPLPTATQVPSGFKLISLSSPVNVGGNASASIQTQAGASCSISYVTPHGTQSRAQGLVPETAGSNGVCAWTWKIGTGTEPGTGTVTITANGQTQSFPIVIQ